MELLRLKSPTKLYTVYLCALDPWFKDHAADVRRIARGQVWASHTLVIERMERVLLG